MLKKRSPVKVFKIIFFQINYTMCRPKSYESIPKVSQKPSLKDERLKYIVFFKLRVI